MIVRPIFFRVFFTPSIYIRDAPVPVLIGSKEPKPVEPIGTETGTDENRLEPKPEPMRTDWNRNRNRLEQKRKPIRTDWNRNRNR